MQRWRAPIGLGILVAILGLSACRSTDSLKSFGPFSPPDLQQAARVNVQLGLGYLAQGQMVRAKTKLIHALELNPQSPEAHSAMAHFLETVGETADAEQEHQHALRYAKGEGGFYNNYAVFLCRQARYEESDRLFHRALQDKKYPKTAEVYENAGTCAHKAGALKQAEQYFQAAILQDPQRDSAHDALLALRSSNSS